MILNLYDISFNELEESRNKDKYLYALKYHPFAAKDNFKVGELISKTFDFVKTLQFEINETGLTFQRMIELLSLSGNESLFALKEQSNYLIEQVKYINNIEAEGLGSSVTNEEEAAGVGDFEAFGSFLQYDSLADGDITKFEAIGKLKYSECFAKLKLDKTKNDYRNRLLELNKPRTI